jgi:hypothetical protein
VKVANSTKKRGRTLIGKNRGKVSPKKKRITAKIMDTARPLNIEPI